MKKKSKKQARAFLKSLGYLKTFRVIEGDEREKTLTMLRLIPCLDSNNQHLWTKTWTVGSITYEHTTGEDFDELVEITEDDI